MLSTGFWNMLKLGFMICPVFLLSLRGKHWAFRLEDRPV